MTIDRSFINSLANIASKPIENQAYIVRTKKGSLSVSSSKEKTKINNGEIIKLSKKTLTSLDKSLSKKELSSKEALYNMVVLKEGLSRIKEKLEANPQNDKEIKRLAKIKGQYEEIIQHVESKIKDIESKDPELKLFSEFIKKQLSLVKTGKRIKVNSADYAKYRKAKSDLTRGEFKEQWDSGLEGYVKETSLSYRKIKQAFGDQHYVFRHGQATSLMPLIELTEAISLHEGRPPQEMIKPMRYLSPEDAANKRDIESFKKESLEAKRTDQPSQQAGQRFDHKKTKDLISVDANPENNWAGSGESPEQFLTLNINVMDTVEISLREFDRIAGQYSSNPEFVAKQREKFKQLVEKFQHLNNIGNLFVICVPKELQPKIAYPSEAYGYYREDWDRPEVLEQEQNERQFDLDAEQPVQYRLLASELNADNRVKIFFLSHVTKDLRRELKNEIRILVAEMAAQHQLETSKTKLA